MKFVENNLLDDEKIVYQAQIHWMIFAHGLLWFFVGVFFYIYGTSVLHLGDSATFFSSIFVLLALYNFIKSYMHKYFTELAITNRRLVAKFGFIRRETIEIPLLKVESVQIDQAILERIVGSGSVGVSGTGSSMAPVKFIDAPVEFRNNLNKAIAEARAKNGREYD